MQCRYGSALVYASTARSQIQCRRYCGRASLSRVRWSKSYPPAHHGCDRTRSQLVAVSQQHRLTGRTLILRLNVHQTNDAAMRLTERHRKLSEILVERNQHSRFTLGNFEDRGVAGVRSPVAHPDHLMSCRSERRPRARRDTLVEQQLQCAELTNAGSKRSRPTTRRA
jgi:hypothetical protein